MLNITKLLVNFFETFSFLPDLDIFCPLPLQRQPTESDGLLIQPNSLFLPYFFFKRSESLYMWLYKHLLLSFLLFENRLDLFNLGIKSAKKLIASINFLLFLLKKAILIF
jgi:hypothetical protein